MKKIYYLSSCDSCRKIMKALKVDDSWEKQDIKTNKISAKQLDKMAEMAGSYEALFSRSARKYREMQLKEKALDQKDYRELILEEYTFLKRPVMILGDTIFTGNSKKTLAAALKVVNKEA